MCCAGIAVKVRSWAAVRLAAPFFETRRYLWNVLKHRRSVAHFVCGTSQAPSVHSQWSLKTIQGLLTEERRHALRIVPASSAEGNRHRNIKIRNFPQCTNVSEVSFILKVDEADYSETSRLIIPTAWYRI